jgi:hypothetical protein
MDLLKYVSFKKIKFSNFVKFLKKINLKILYFCKIFLKIHILWLGILYLKIKFYTMIKKIKSDFINDSIISNLI